jgi:hypothetical protein
MLSSGTSEFGLPLDFVVLFAITGVLVLIGGALYPTVVR